ncbi:MAG: hypothetical protein ABIP35_03900 [Ginsengibacter sp.]
MTAYSHDELYNCYVNSEANSAFESSEISKEILAKVKGSYSCKLYTPSLFIAIALGIVTVIAVIFTGFLVWLLANADSSTGITFICLLMTLISYVLLEWMVKRKKYFNAGVDNALMLLVLGFLAGAILGSVDNPPWIFFNGLMMVVSLWLSIRFADSLMTIVSGSFFLVFCFLLILKTGNAAIIYFPFGMMGIIAILYFGVAKLKKHVSFVYEKCISVLTVFLLLAFYIEGNYWIVNELQSVSYTTKAPFAFGWLFWIFTYVIPVIYIVYGIMKKDLLHIRSGIILVAATVFTYKYYHDLLPLEFEMLLVGLLLVGISYYLIKWLSPSRNGFTSEATSSQPAWKNVEALIIAETMGGDKPGEPDQIFSGGSGGGGGATGDF